MSFLSGFIAGVIFGSFVFMTGAWFAVYLSARHTIKRMKRINQLNELYKNEGDTR